jgi:hypothetical protein
MKKSRLLRFSLFCLALAWATAARPAFLSIQEGPGGVVFSGDCNFSCNDWVGGTATQEQNGPEFADVTVNIYNPNGPHPTNGSLEVYSQLITDPDGSFSDYMTFIFTPLGGDYYQMTALFCSLDENSVCTPPPGSLFHVPTEIYEDAHGNFSFVTPLDPNLAIGGTSADPVPEPETYSMMLAGLGLLGLVARRRKLKAA